MPSNSNLPVPLSSSSSRESWSRDREQASPTATRPRLPQGHSTSPPTPYLSVRGQAVFPFFLLPSALYHRLCGLPNATTLEAALRCTIPCEDYQSSFIGPTLNDKNSVKTLKWTETGT